MSARDYLRLLTDSPTIVGTLRRKYGAPDPALALPYGAGEAARAVARIHPARIAVHVVRLVDETPSTRTLVLAGVDGPLPPYLPGQYVNVFVEVNRIKTSRPMSIASPPGSDGTLSLTVKRMPAGLVSHHLTRVVQLGDRLAISGPEGDFCHNPVRDGDDLVFIAGGSGITPFVGMAEHLLVTRASTKILLLYASRAPEEIIFEHRLRRLAALHGRLQAVFVVDDPAPHWEGATGRIDEEILRRHLGPSPADKVCFVCGPPAMQRDVARHLRALGIPPSQIRVEAGRPEAAPTRISRWPAALSPDQRVTLKIESTDERVEASAGESLLAALERAGHAVPALCRSGSCGSCRTKIVSGNVITPDQPEIRATDRAAGFVHACVGHATGDVTLRVAGARARLAPPAPAWPAVAEPAQRARSTAVARRQRSARHQILFAASAVALCIYLVTINNAVTADNERVAAADLAKTIADSAPRAGVAVPGVAGPSVLVPSGVKGPSRTQTPPGEPCPSGPCRSRYVPGTPLAPRSAPSGSPPPRAPLSPGASARAFERLEASFDPFAAPGRPGEQTHCR